MKTIALIMNQALGFKHSHHTLVHITHSFNLPSLMCTCNTEITCSRHTLHSSLTMDLNKAPMGPFQMHDPQSHKMNTQIFYGCINGYTLKSITTWICQSDGDIPTGVKRKGSNTIKNGVQRET